MDAWTRGIIETWIDDVIEKHSIPETVNLILREDDEVVSKEDLVLGYFLGSIMRASCDLVENRKFWKEFTERMERIRKKTDKELEKKVGKERFIELVKERTEMEKKAPLKRVRPIMASLDTEEENEIRRILLSKIKLFREKIRKEPYR